MDFEIVASTLNFLKFMKMIVSDGNLNFFPQYIFDLIIIHIQINNIYNILR